MDFSSRTGPCPPNARQRGAWSGSLSVIVWPRVSSWFKVGLFAIEGQRPFMPPRRGRPAPEQCAMQRANGAMWRGQFDAPAVAQGEALGRDEAQAARMDVAREQEPPRRANRVGKEPEPS